MEEQAFKKIVANNITEYRKKFNLTQLELAEKLDYSDKSISKWERAEAVPDAYILHKLADLFGISVDAILSENAIDVHKPIQAILRKKVLIPTLAAIGVFAIAIVIFAFLVMLKAPVKRPWLCFIYALPVASFILSVFSFMWGKIRVQVFFTSCFNWMTALLVFFLTGMQKEYLFFIIAAATQLIIIFWFLLRNSSRH